MSVYQDPRSPYWQYDFQRRGVRFYGSLTVRTDRPKRDAQAAEKVIKASVGLTPGRAPISLEDACDKYWNERAKHFADSVGENGRLNHLKRLLGTATTLDQIGDAELSEYVAIRRGEKRRGKKADRPTVSNATVNRELECLRRICKRAGKVWKRMTSEAEFSQHLLDEPKERIRSLTSDEDDALFAAIEKLRPDFRDVWLFKLLTGKRLSEVIGLEKRRIDRKNMTAVTVQKGGQEIVITLVPSTIAIVERNWLNHPTHLFTYICKKSRIGRKKGRRYPFTKDGWRKQWADILAEAKITDFRVHDLRHTAATRILAMTGNLKLVQSALSHSTITASARYAHTTTDQLRAALEAAETMRSPGQESRNDQTADAKSKDGTGT